MALAWAGFSTQMPVDWALELVLTQELKPFYAASNPPLYSWIAWALQRVLPPGQSILLIVNYAATFALFWLTAYAGHRVLEDRVLAALAPWSLFVIIPYGRLNFGYVNTQLLLPLILASVVLLIEIGRRPRWSLFVALGLVVGLGTLAKLNYLFAVVCLLGAVLLQTQLRAGLLRPWLALALVIAVGVVAPFAVAFQEAGNDIIALLRSKTSTGASLSYGEQVRAGLASTGYGTMAYVGPSVLIALAGVVFARGFLIGDAARVANRQFLRDALLLGVVVILVGIFAFGITRMKIWYLHAFFLPAPLYALAIWDRDWVPPILRRALGAVVLGFVVVQTALRLVEFTPYCLGKCRDVVPYDELAAHLRQAGFERGTILGIGVRVGGNLRPHFPQARVGVINAQAELRHLPRRRARPIGQCLVIWRADEVESLVAARRMAAQTFVALQLVEQASEAPVRTARLGLHGWPAAGRPGRPGTIVWHYILIEQGNVRCG